MLRHVYEEDLGVEEFQKSQSGWYRALRTLAQREDGSVRRRQHCFPNMAWLNNERSLNPIPPSDFGVVSHSHERQCSFFFPFSIPHHWLAIDFHIDSQVETGN
jgi:hypothetical protein